MTRVFVNRQLIDIGEPGSVVGSPLALAVNAALRCWLYCEVWSDFGEIEIADSRLDESIPLATIPMHRSVRRWVETHERLGPSYCCERAFDLDIPRRLLRASE
jgi:hypothetical protein